jgi:FkbM family methyltransferase
MSSPLKRKVYELVASVMRGKHDGLGLFGKLMEKVARYVIFIANAERLSFMNGPQTQNHAPILPNSDIAGLVYDVGANNGDDVEYYLKKGLKVVAIEANPTLASAIRSRFADPVRRGALTVLNVAVGSKSGRALFYVSMDNDKIGSLTRPPDCFGDLIEVDVEVRTLSSIIDEFGDPAFVKVDIEGLDAAILHEMFSTGCMPNLLSAESHSLEILCELIVAGYRKFKVVEGKFVGQRFCNHQITTTWKEMVRHNFPEHSSGPFGDDLPGTWMDIDDTFRYLCQFGLGWKDIHARR